MIAQDILEALNGLIANITEYLNWFAEALSTAFAAFGF